MKRFLFYVVFNFVSLAVFAQQPAIKFTHLSTLDGLSQNSIACIIKDKEGIIWFGTQDGLNKYDGYTFTVYRNDPKDPKSLRANDIGALYEDKQGNLWIGSNGGGLSLYNRQTDSFIHFIENPKDQQALSDKSVMSILEDSKGNFWVGTYNGLNLFNRKTKKFTRYTSNPQDPSTLTNSEIQSIFEDRKGNLWVGTTKGLNQFNYKTGAFKHFLSSAHKPASISHNYIKYINEDSRGNLWIGTKGGGLNLFHPATEGFSYFMHNPKDPASIRSNIVLSIVNAGSGKLYVGTEAALEVFDTHTGTFTHYTKELYNTTSLSSNSILSILLDRQGILWVGTYSGGMNKYDPNLYQFEIYKNHDPDKNTLSSNLVTSFAEAPSGNIWVGTDGGGLNLFNIKTKKFTRYLSQPNNLNSLSNNSIQALLQSKKSTDLWIGTYEGGLDKYDFIKNKFTHYTEENDSYHLNNNSVFALLEDRHGNIYIGTNGGGLNVFNVKTQRFIKYQHDPLNSNSLSENYITSLLEDNTGAIWVGTYSGSLNVFDPVTQQFTQYNRQNSNISNVIINTLFKDSKDNIWVGTIGGGLNLFNPKTKTFTVFTQHDGLPNNVINSIIEDDNDFLWLSTNNGISRFNPNNKTFKNYSLSNGLQNYEFSAASGLKSSTGEIYFGGIEGFNVLDPRNLSENQNIPPVILTDFHLFNKSVSIGKNSPLKQHISQTKTLTLPYDQAVFALEYAALNYTVPEHNQYAYILENFDKQWSYVGTERKATYTNLNPGEYTFKVKAANNDGVWNEQGATLKIIITPPYYMTWWFRLLIAGVLVGGAWGYYHHRMQIIRQQQIMLEQQVQERTAQVSRQKEELETQATNLLQLNKQLQSQQQYEKQAKEEAEQARQEAEKANQAKSIFLATMSHEIRTPLNGVIGMTSLLTETHLDPEQRHFADIIRRSGQSLLSVINDVLDFSKIESGKMELDPQPFDLRVCLEEVLELFADKAAQQQLELLYDLDENVPLSIVGDCGLLQQILINLVGNALKFTSQGEIVVEVKSGEVREHHQLELSFSVRDTGIGFSPEKAANLFQAFSQLDSSTTRKYGGTGLGLAICKRLVDLMGGQISANSQPGQGTNFYFTIQAQLAPETKATTEEEPTGDLQGKAILVVTANATYRELLQKQLRHWHYHSVAVPAAREALAVIKEQDFDLVLTDRYLPGMDGISLALALREDQPHLPLVLLCSLGNDLNSESRGLFTAVVSKPTKYQTLQGALANSLLHQPFEQELMPAEQKLSSRFADNYPLRILVAEDYPINQMFAQLVLERLGYQVVMAENGVQALTACNHTHYDVILMDVQMPEMDGLEATRVLRAQESSHQPYIIATTASALSEDEQACKQAGMNAYISKPIDLDELMLALQKAFTFVQSAELERIGKEV
ncbi:hybrid sensor histidine kinase/response regulator [Adhaeribacter pallidiroseus]|uniref:histidine kinase n=1 Tax=Adhaeribacter pallidiroseus TaxID=2072847 RepID=A0A369QGD1_9BACT|nr:two-component regulator propeller domain-containing protein [Adhaeribacter pallidiroseus]RDC63991.1 Hybrid signal transduction histidine kinase [Adhaeribacter pallidiroseus]